MSNMECITITLTPEMAQVVRGAVEAGDSHPPARSSARPYPRFVTVEHKVFSLQLLNFLYGTTNVVPY
jgi:hypothetical protein